MADNKLRFPHRSVRPDCARLPGNAPVPVRPVPQRLPQPRGQPLLRSTSPTPPNVHPPNTPVPPPPASRSARVRKGSTSTTSRARSSSPCGSIRGHPPSAATRSRTLTTGLLSGDTSIDLVPRGEEGRSAAREGCDRAGCERWTGDWRAKRHALPRPGHGSGATGAGGAGAGSRKSLGEVREDDAADGEDAGGVSTAGPRLPPGDPRAYGRTNEEFEKAGPAN